MPLDQSLSKEDLTCSLLQIASFLERSTEESDYNAIKEQLNFCLHIIAKLDASILPPIAVINCKGKA